MISNTSGSDCGLRWEPWQHNVSRITAYIGVKRRIKFRSAFQNPPKVISNLKLINLRSLDLVLKDLGYKPENENETDRLRQLHVLSNVEQVDNEGFIMIVGVGLPARAGDELARHLQKDPPKESTIDDVIGFASSCQQQPQDNWMLKFYESIGTIEVSWLAQANEH